MDSVLADAFRQVGEEQMLTVSINSRPGGWAVEYLHETHGNYLTLLGETVTDADVETVRNRVVAWLASEIE